MQNSKVLVTGGLGQVGSYVCEALLKAGHAVTILDSAPVSAVPAGCTIVRDDIRNRQTVGQLVRDADVVVHCAAQIFVARSIEDPLYDAENNVLGTLNLLDAARRSNVKRFVYFSSAAVYGDTVRLPVDEEHPQNPLSPYGVSKLAGEKYAMAFHAVYGLPTTAIRPFNIYSPRQDPANPYSGVISKFIDRIGHDLQPLVYGDGTATRDFVSVHDVVAMVELMLEKPAATGKIFNCGTGRSTTIGRLAELIASLSARPELKPVLLPDRPGDIKHSYADISLARQALGYEPRVTLEEGLRELIDLKIGRSSSLRGSPFASPPGLIGAEPSGGGPRARAETTSPTAPGPSP